MHQQPMVPDHGTKYEENPSSHHEECEGVEHPDGQTHGLDPFLYSPRICLGRPGNKTIEMRFANM